MTEPADTSASAAPAAANDAANDAAAAEKNPLLRHADFYFPADTINQKVDTTLMHEQSKVALPGFRRGKVPLSMLRQRFGRNTLHEVLQKECGFKFQEELEKQQQRAAGMPQLALPDVASDGQYHVHCHYEVLPDIAAPDFSGKKLERPTFTVDDAAVNEMIEILRKQRGQYVAVDGTAQEEDDRLRVDFTSTFIEADGSRGEVMETGENRPLPLNDQTMRPELRDALKGAVAGDTREVQLKIPEQAEDEKLRGREFVMQVTVKAVERLNKAELNDEFFAAFGDEEKSLESFRRLVRSHLERESQVRLRNFLHARAMDMLIAATPPFPLPQSMLVAECRRMMAQAEEEWKRRGMADSAAQLSLQMFAPQAGRRVVLGLIMAAWQQRENPDIGEADISARLQEIASAYEDPAAVAAQLRENKEEMHAIYLSLLEDRVTDWICSRCESEDKPMALADFLNLNAA